MTKVKWYQLGARTQQNFHFKQRIKLVYLSSHDTIFKVKVERMVTIIFKLNILILYSYQHVITNASIFQKE